MIGHLLNTLLILGTLAAGIAVGMFALVLVIRGVYATGKIDGSGSIILAYPVGTLAGCGAILMLSPYTAQLNQMLRAYYG